MLVHEEVRTALEEGRPVVALESTIIAHGLPRPDNLRVAREIEAVVRERGAVPATIAILAGEVLIGLDDDQLEALAASGEVAKCGVRDLAPVLARGEDGATTVAATSHLARAGRHPRVRHRRARRRAPRRARHLRRVRGPGHARARRDLRRLRGREVDPRHPGHARAARDAQRDRARLPHRHVPRLLPDVVAGCRSRGGWIRRRRSRRCCAQREAIGAPGAVVVANPLDEPMDPELHDRLLREGLAGGGRAGRHRAAT